MPLLWAMGCSLHRNQGFPPSLSPKAMDSGKVRGHADGGGQRNMEGW